uniref:Arrestin-like N-terminal domain-containing protein n=1 Tax=Paramormyrops kingsleyae TaxID=1676925 RepID=A0A3B3SGN0_9TELE
MLSSIKSITVNYDAVNEGKTFSSGDMLSGRVLLVLSRETKIKGLRVKMKGKAKVHWREFKDKTCEHYKSKEKYFKLEQLVIGQEKDTKFCTNDLRQSLKKVIRWIFYFQNHSSVAVYHTWQQSHQTENELTPWPIFGQLT